MAKPKQKPMHSSDLSRIDLSSDEIFHKFFKGILGRLPELPALFFRGFALLHMPDIAPPINPGFGT